MSGRTEKQSSTPSPAPSALKKPLTSHLSMPPPVMQQLGTLVLDESIWEAIMESNQYLEGMRLLPNPLGLQTPCLGTASPSYINSSDPFSILHYIFIFYNRRICIRKQRLDDSQKSPSTLYKPRTVVVLGPVFSARNNVCTILLALTLYHLMLH